MERSNRICLR